MRLIDADELIKTFEKETGYKWNEKCILLCPKCFIDNAPTVEERPQGEWIIIDKYSDDFKCSVCNSYPLERGDYPELSKFCPACGAKMKMPT